jgi:pimeloyl-ACP methyl ester carboxylesterase
VAVKVRPVADVDDRPAWPRLVVEDLVGASSGYGRSSPAARRPEQSRARYPDEEVDVVRDGVRVFWERYGDGTPTILLMPTWSVLHSRHWKLQIPYLARHFRVVTFDGRGNGRSDRPTETAAYADTEFVGDAIAVLDATGTNRAVVAGLSMGAGYAIRLAADHPDRVLGLALFGASVPVWDRDPSAAPGPGADFTEPQPDDIEWHKYNAHFWRRDWPDFAAFFAGEKIFSEPHSTKPIEDSIGWFLETDPETIVTAEYAPFLRPSDDRERTAPTEGDAFPFLRRVRCPALVVHGTDDRIVGIRHARVLAEALDAPLVEVAGGGHSTIGRDPVLANVLIRRFVRSLEAAP